MKSDFRLVISLICAVSFIFVLRDSDTSPSGFLREQIKRVLDDNTLTDKYCSGINLQTVITSMDVKESDGVRKSLSKVRHGNPLITFIEGPDSRDDFLKKYLLPIIAYSAPWVIFFAITLLTCIGFILNWCCMYCSCCKCCKCCGLPKTSNRARGYAGASIFFGIATIAVAVAGIILSRGVATGGNATLCAGVTLLAKLVEGDSSQKWVGVEPLAAKLYAVLSTYDSTVNQIRANYPASNLGLSTHFQTKYTASTTDVGYNAAVRQVQNMYNSYKTNPISRADPTYMASSYVPDYISNLGPDSNSTTNTGLIEAEMTDKMNRTKNAATNTDNSISILLAAQLLFQEGLAKGEQSALNASISFAKLYGSLDNFGSKGKTAFNAIGGGLLGLFVLEGVLALFALFSICLVCRGAKSFNKGIHLSWCCIGLLSLLTWILAAVTLPTSLILFEVCDASNLFLNNSTFFNQTFDKFLPAEVTESQTAAATSALSSLSVVGGTIASTNTDDDKDSNNKTITKARTILYNCLFADTDDQDLLKILNVSTTLGYFNNLMEPYDSVSDLTGTIAVNSVQIPIQETEVSAYKAGTVSDSNQVTIDLATLNTYTNKATQSCTTAQDTWVLNSASCTSSMGTVFPSGGADTFNLGLATCIGFDVWTTQTISNRYTSSNYPATCATVGTYDMLTYVKTFVNDFVSDRGQVSTLFNNLGTSLTGISSSNDALISDIQSATSDYPLLRNITATWYTAITDPKVGVYKNSKCTFVRGSVQTLRDTMCTAFIVDLFQASVAIVVISFMSMLAYFMLFCLAKRFVVETPNAGKQGAKTNKYAY